MKTKILFLAVALCCSLMAAVAIGAQKSIVIKGGKYCEGYLLKKIAKEKAQGSRIVKLRAFNPNDETLSPSLKDRVRKMREDRLVAFELRSHEKNALVLRSASHGATGLATNLECWHITAGSIITPSYTVTNSYITKIGIILPSTWSGI